MAELHREISFEDEVYAYLGGHGWFYAPGDAQDFDRALALYPADLIAWIKDADPKAWETLNKDHGEAAEDVVLTRVRKSLDEQGALNVLRQGVELVGLRQPIPLAQFR